MEYIVNTPRPVKPKKEYVFKCSEREAFLLHCLIGNMSENEMRNKILGCRDFASGIDNAGGGNNIVRCDIKFLESFYHDYQKHNS